MVGQDQYLDGKEIGAARMLTIVTRSGQVQGFLEALDEADRSLVNEHIKVFSLSGCSEGRSVDQVGRFVVDIVVRPTRGGRRLFVQSVHYAA